MLINKTTGVCFDEILSKSYSMNNIGTKPIKDIENEYGLLYEQDYRDADPNLDNMNSYLSIEEVYERMNSIPCKVKIKLLKR